MDHGTGYVGEYFAIVLIMFLIPSMISFEDRMTTINSGRDSGLGWWLQLALFIGYILLSFVSALHDRTLLGTGIKAEETAGHWNICISNCS